MSLIMFAGGMVFGLLFGLLIGLRAYARQRSDLDYALYQMNENIEYLSDITHDERVDKTAVQGWIASIRTDFTPSRRWR